MKITHLALDLDGTLTFENMVLDPIALEAVQRAKDGGLEAFIVSGVPVQALRRVAPLVGAAEYYIGENGGVVFDGEEIHVLNTMEKMDACWAEIQEKIPSAELYSNADTRLSEVCLKLTVPIKEVDAIASKYGFHTQSSRFGLHVLASEITKAHGIRFLAEKKGFKMENVCAIGDAPNDIEMIKEAGFGVAVANALPVVKETADYVTNKSTASGVLEAIELILEKNSGHGDD